MGETFAAVNNVSELALLAALASLRFATAFVLLPLLAQETVPQLVRGAIFLAFGVITLALQPAVNVTGWSVSQWIGLFSKEAFIGLALGMLLAALLWAFDAAFAQVAGLSFLLAAPTLVVMYAIDLALGLMNRFAPQLNLYSLSSSLKSVAAILLWLVMLTTLAKTLLNYLAALFPTLLNKMQTLLPT